MSLMKPPNKKIMAKPILTRRLPCSGAKPGNEANKENYGQTHSQQCGSQAFVLSNFDCYCPVDYKYCRGVIPARDDWIWGGQFWGPSLKERDH